MDAGGRTVADSGSAHRARLTWALRIGAVIWLFLLLAGFFAPGGWSWGMAGPVGHIENYMISLWLVALVLAPLIASRDPLRSTGVIQVYLLGIAAILLSTIRGEPPKLLADAPPWIAALISVGLVVRAHANPRQLLRLG